MGRSAYDNGACAPNSGCWTEPTARTDMQSGQSIPWLDTFASPGSASELICTKPLPVQTISKDLGDTIGDANATPIDNANQTSTSLAKM